MNTERVLLGWNGSFSSENRIFETVFDFSPRFGRLLIEFGFKLRIRANYFCFYELLTKTLWSPWVTEGKSHQWVPRNLSVGEIPWLWHFMCAWKSADADCVISIEYNSELGNHVSKMESSNRAKLDRLQVKWKKHELSEYVRLAGTSQMFWNVIK